MGITGDSNRGGFRPYTPSNPSVPKTINTTELNNLPAMAVAPGASSASTVNNTSVVNPALAVAFPLTTAAIQKLLLRLLNLPPDFMMLLNELAEPVKNPAAKAKQTLQAEVLTLLANSDTPITPDQLQKLLLSRLTESRKHASELMKQPGGASETTHQAVEWLSQLQTVAEKTPAKSLQSLLLLYLPIQPPMPPPQLGFITVADDDTPSGGSPKSDGMVTLTVETSDHGLFIIRVTKGEQPNTLWIGLQNHSGSLLPEAKESLHRTLITTLKAHQLPPCTVVWEASKRPLISASSLETENTGTKITVMPNNGVPAGLLSAAFLTAKTLLTTLQS
ncbi:MAG: hypothetical protein QE263_07070 [Vampirovibrionales bacterium]|nr:hypothetical protein [Vampirovibrionales bacterium]